ncbi:glycosyl-phosphatidylinositol-anchored molecule-like protein [Alexandromys fortis]|uniref:glycosyl-phosphatidylinositol-anchored molecule-like protein n=1 Tax=Alexandromys fortis TaxID=100897 RepID=UPI0021536701|nr:glycosyl-phosphatidylinositol-anchored molecule-like protein [Microtus fortis]
MMLTFFLLILLGLPCVDTAVNSSLVLDDSTIGLDNSTSGLNSVIQPRQNLKGVILHLASFLGMSSRQLLIYKACIRHCPFLQSPAPMILRRLATTNSFYYTNCCTGLFCNDGGPTNIERDLLPPRVFEEDVIARAVHLGQFNLLLSLVLILSSSIPT